MSLSLSWGEFLIVILLIYIVGFLHGNNKKDIPKKKDN